MVKATPPPTADRDQIHRLRSARQYPAAPAEVTHISSSDRGVPRETLLWPHERLGGPIIRVYFLLVGRRLTEYSYDDSNWGRTSFDSIILRKSNVRLNVIQMICEILRLRQSFCAWYAKKQTMLSDRRKRLMAFWRPDSKDLWDFL